MGWFEQAINWDRKRKLKKVYLAQLDALPARAGLEIRGSDPVAAAAVQEIVKEHPGVYEILKFEVDGFAPSLTLMRPTTKRKTISERQYEHHKSQGDLIDTRGAHLLDPMIRAGKSDDRTAEEKEVIKLMGGLV